MRGGLGGAPNFCCSRRGLQLAFLTLQRAGGWKARVPRLLIVVELDKGFQLMAES